MNPQSLIYNIAVATMVKEAVDPSTMAMLTGVGGAGIGAAMNYNPKMTMQEAGKAMSPSGDYKDLGVNPASLMAHRIASGIKASYPEAILAPMLKGNPLAMLAAAPRFASGMARGEEQAVQQLLNEYQNPEDKLRDKAQGIGAQTTNIPILRGL